MTIPIGSRTPDPEPRIAAYGSSPFIRRYAFNNGAQDG
jgi:hypothetical protein